MKLFVAPQARRDVGDILRRSVSQFGADARDRYRALILRSYSDLLADPSRAGVHRGPVGDVRLYHLRHSRAVFPAGSRTRAPKHLIAFRIKGDLVEVIRVLHEAMDIERHLSESGGRRQG